MKKLNALILAIILIVVSTLVIILFGKTYTVKIPNVQGVTNVDELDITIEDNIVKCIDKKYENETLYLTFESVSKGKTYVQCIVNQEDNVHYYFSIYVHKFGIITYKNFFGDCTGSIIIPISICVWLLLLIVLVYKDYKTELAKNMYQYKNVAFLGLFIFLIITLLSQILLLLDYQGLIQVVREVLRLCSFFSMLTLPIALITSILVTISNLVLIKKEGFSVTNLLGVFLGILFCFGTLFPNLLNDYLQTATWVDVHNEQGIALYVQEFVELVVYSCIAYLECILLGTIILAIKAAKHIPKFDKDFIIIHGCQIKKDGSLTNLLKGRTDRAIEFSNMQKENTGKELIFIPSGGKGNDEVISEAEAINNYLLEKGISKDKIIMEDKSLNTLENIVFSKEIIESKMKDAKIAISTTNYHVFRAGVIASSQGINVEGIGAKTKSYFWINAFIREFIATLNAEKKKHFLLTCGLIVLGVLMIVLLYISNMI